MTKYEELKKALEANLKHERHRTLAETRYWCDQYKLLAQQAIEALAQPAQEPVAMRYDYDGYGYKYIDSGSGSDWQTRIKDAEPIYAIPSQRPAAVGEDKKEWVRLTDDDIHEAYLKHRDMDDYARMIQAKLKDKNT